MMFHPTAPLARSLRRLALTTKQAGKDYYKGTGSGSMGSHTKWGGYKIDWMKVRTYKVPDLNDFPLTPFVAKNISVPERQRVMGKMLGKGLFPSSSPRSGADYLERWKAEGGTS